jgi:hypothetical protein
MAELGAQVDVGGLILQDLFGLGAESGDEVFHLSAVLTLSGGIDQTVDAIDERPPAPVGLRVTGLVTPFPT